MKKFAVIVAGGTGSRMGNQLPKQFLEIAGKPVLMYTINTFYSYDKTIKFIVVLPKNQIEKWNELCSIHHFKIKHQIVEGGETRFSSVKNGLSFVDEEGIVFIHDGVRPLVNKKTLNTCLKTASEKGNAIPVLPLTESIRKGNQQKSCSVDRNEYFLVQTPQTFQCRLIKDAYNKSDNKQYTDDASVIEAFGLNVYLVEGNRENIKITYPEDLKWVNSFLV